MAQPARPLRADAARNRARVLEVAYETFAAEGLSVPIDEIARRAGVGAGTVYRHFPTKEDALSGGHRRPAAAHHRRRVAPADNPMGPARRCSPFCARWSCTGAPRTAAWSTRWPGSASTSTAAAPDAEDAFMAVLGELLAPRRRRAPCAPRRRRARGEGAPGRVPGDGGVQRGVGRAGDRRRHRRSARRSRLSVDPLLALGMGEC